MTTKQSLKLLRDKAHTLEGETSTKFSFAAGAVKTLGNILFSHESKSIKGMNDEDIQGLCLAVESLGGYLEHLASDLEMQGRTLAQGIKELESAP